MVAKINETARDDRRMRTVEPRLSEIPSNPSLQSPFPYYPKFLFIRNFTALSEFVARVASTHVVHAHTIFIILNLRL